MQAASLAAVCFGKLPTHGDFVRHHVGGPDGGRGLQALDTWLQRGLVQAHRRLGVGFEASFDAAPGICFVMDPPAGDHVLAGVLRPSRDTAGRRYPFLVAVSIPRSRVDGRRLPSWPLRYQAFFAEATALVADVVAQRLADEHLPDRLVRLRDLFDDTHFVVDYEYRLRQAQVWPLWGRTWGTSENGRKYVLLKNLTEGFAAARGWPARLPLRFPYPSIVESMDASFWLEICWHLHGKPPAKPAFFWPEADVDGALLVSLAHPPPALFSHLFTNEAHDDGCFYLDDPDGKPTALAALALPAMHTTLLEDETLSYRAFIDQL